MASPICARAMLVRPLRTTLSSRTARTPSLRHFTSTHIRHAEITSPPPPIYAPPRRPVGAFRGGLLGFLAGALTASAAMYYYIIEEYRVSNELLTEDIYNLGRTVQRVEDYVRKLEERIEVGERKRRV